MRFATDTSFAGGKWKFATASHWQRENACFEFSVQGQQIKMVQFGSPLDVNDATLPLLRLYGNQSGSCPVRLTPRPGVAPGWTVTQPDSQCVFSGRDDSDSVPSFMRFNMTGPSASQLCPKIMSALTTGLDPSLAFQLTPFVGQTEGLQLQCELSVSSTELGDTIHQELAPGDYTVTIRSESAWVVKSNLWEVGFGRCS